jgi:hypothetical protein
MALIETANAITLKNIKVEKKFHPLKFCGEVIAHATRPPAVPKESVFK